MKKLILIFSMVLTSTLVFAQEKEDKTLYIIDGVVSSKAAADELQSNTIRNMNVVKGVDKVVIITTKAGREISGHVVDTNVVVIKVRGEKKTDGAPLYLIKSSDGNIKKVDNIDSISPNDIKTMNVYKGNNGEQFKEYGNTTNGVILIELK